jgi:spermidine synthase
MYAISTVGSLVGTFASALLLIPLAGTQRTFLVFALALAVVATLGLGRRWALAPLGVAALLALPIGTVKAAEDGRVVHETDTEYQYARVIDHPDGSRTLELNEGQAIHSLYRPGSVLTGGYWDGFLVAPFAVLREPPRRVAILGFAGGTTARAYARYFPAARIDGVEIDRELFDIGRRWFGLRARPQLHEYAEDARPFLRRVDARYDAIFIDAYRQPYIPFYLSTREFFQLVRDRLAPGGVVIVNVGHPDSSDRLEQVLSATMATAFPHLARDPVEPTNTLLMGSRRPITAGNLRAAASRLPADLRPLALRTVPRLAPPLRGGAVYTDDKAPVEWLVDKSIVEYAAHGGG